VKETKKLMQFLCFLTTKMRVPCPRVALLIIDNTAGKTATCSYTSTDDADDGGWVDRAEIYGHGFGSSTNSNADY
jgi:hypothetical protein